MPRISPLKTEEAQPQTKEVLNAIQKKLGSVPNIYSTLGKSPTALKALIDFNQQLSSGSFSQKESEAVALAVAQANQCQYCLAAHSLLGKMAGLDEKEALALRKGSSSNLKLKALVALAVNIVETRGVPKQELIDEFHTQGYSEAALIDLIALIALNTFTNYFNHIAQTEVDFPRPPDL